MVDQVTEIGSARVNVVLRRGDVIHAHLAGGGRLDLHDADGSLIAAGVHVEARLLVRLCQEQQPVEIVLAPVLLEQQAQRARVLDGFELADPRDARRVLRVAADEDVARQRAAPARPDEVVEGVLEDGAVLADRPTHRPLCPHREFRMELQPGEDLRPELGLVRVYHRGPDFTRADKV